MPKGLRNDGRARLTYGRAREIEARYLARVARGGRVHQKAEEREALATVAAFKKAAPAMVDKVLEGLAKGRPIHRTQKRLDAFRVTKTPLPAEWTEETSAPATGPAPKLSQDALALANTIARAVDEYMRTHR